MTALAKKVFELFGKPELSIKPEGNLLQERKAKVIAMPSRPFINDRGELIIPPTSDPRYHWWAGGQSVAQTLAELNAPPAVWRRYVTGYTETVQ